ncbi:hypothetical protein AJ78_07690 [Emergomyces pasteurianus Ep9510]|uniref:Uncharacterized protein n=1 Tax=Emergomyces pasteurianus Ep9510 TaxID=1447872 RepID=A0A1J9Q5P3_9EURO|nr:hypothetical protein AJ78_07690 [Emergomyces pasteurianus Ep9510]
MTTIQNLSLPDGDLRRAATESKRVRDHNAKWALGIRDPKWTTIGNHIAGEIQNPGYTHVRPVLSMYPKRFRQASQRDTGFQMNRKFADIKDHFNEVVNQALYDDGDYSDSSTDSDNALDLSDPANDPDVFYSFDAPTGPSEGTDILGAALENAMEKFETKETEKMAREYEFVGIEEPTTDHGNGYIADDGDFELISRADL